MSYEQLSLAGFVKEISELTYGPHTRKFCFVLGAGASKESGIKSGEDLVYVWDEELKLRNPENYEKWLMLKGITEENKKSFYSDYYKERFSKHPKDGLHFLEKIMENAKPSCGYVILADILTRTPHNVIITTNFDHLTEDAITYFAQQMPLVVGHESLTSYVRIRASRPTILKIHRDLLLGPASKPEDLQQLDKSWQSLLEQLFKEYHPVFIGYAGNDRSLMDFLCSKANEFANQNFCSPYWMIYGNSAPSGRIHEFLDAANGEYIFHNGFDETIVRIGDALGYKEKSREEFLKENEKRYEELIDSLERFRQERNETDAASDSETTKALAQISEKSGNKTPAQMLEGIWVKSYAEQKEMLNAAMEKYADNSWVLGTYALAEKRAGHYDEAEEYYKRAIKADPTRAGNLGNYANLLNDIRKDYDEAEKYYKLAIEADPNHASNLGNYAILLSDVREDYNEAEKYYKRAIEADPNHANNLGNYANLLKNIHEDYDQAEKYYKRAIEANPNKANHLGNYANLLKNIREDYDEAEKYYKRAIEADPNHASNLGNYANFLRNIREDNDEAEKYYKRAIEADPNHANNLGNYASFLKNIRQDYDEAEEYYKRAIEANPNHANHLGNYANFLKEIRGDTDKAQEYLDRKKNKS